MTSDKEQLGFECLPSADASGSTDQPKRRRPRRASAKAPEVGEPDRPSPDDPRTRDAGAEGSTDFEVSPSDERGDVVRVGPSTPTVEQAQPPGEGSSPVDELTPEDQPAAEHTSDEPGLRLFVLTNRMNLIGVLSSRLLAPRESFTKYYADLLQLAPGWVPVLTTSPPGSLVDQVVSERGSDAPVLIELATSVLDDDVAAPVRYIRAATLADVKGIHFRDAKSLREHRARGYSNVHTHDELLYVSPELFEAPSPCVVDFDPPPSEARVDWREIDRLRGAVGAALASCRSGETLVVASALLGATDVPAETNVPRWLNWSALTADQTPPAGETDQEAADRVVFDSAYRVLGQQDQTESWSPSRVLGLIEATAQEASPSVGVGAIVDRGLKRVRELINLETDFEPFRNPNSPFVATKALLLVLLRPDLEDLLEWPTSETGADDITTVVAALLAGRLRGLARESVRLRNLRVDDLTASWAVNAAKGIDRPLGKAKFVVGDEGTKLVIDGDVVMTCMPLVPDPTPIYEGLESEAKPGARVAISTLLGWPVRITIQLPPGAEVLSSDDSNITVTATADVRLSRQVEEHDFLERIRELRGTARGRAVEALRDMPNP
jgi:hypothetical protein